MTIFSNASNHAIGAVLLQDNSPVAYASRTLNSHETRYSTTEKELLAVVWAVKYFRPYVYGVEFKLNTDHQAIKWLHTKYLGKDKNPRLQRWILSLGEYKINIEYLKGKYKRIADFLSRINADEQEINELTEASSSNEGRDDDSIMIDQDNVSINQTVHSQEEDVGENINILDTVINRFKTQIIIKSDQNNDCKQILGNNRITINSNDKIKNIIDFFKITYQ